jgi:dynein light chain Tctex-type 1
MQKPMKYVCHVSLTQRAGAGLHAASCSRWNPKTDGA